MKILICGDRNWKNRKSIFRELSRYPKGTKVIHGGCRGADKIADSVARYFQFEVVEYPADWEAHGKSAGPIRNIQMLKDNKDIEKVIAFHENIETSKGTKHMVQIATEAGIPVEIIKE